MIEINKLSIIPCSGAIQLECFVPDKSYFENVYIKEIIIDTQDTYSENGPSKTPIYHYDLSKIESEKRRKSLSLIINPEELLVEDINNTLFFVYITARVDGTPSADIPCGLDNTITLEVIFNEDYLYRGSLDYIKEAYNECSIPRNLIDYILRLKALLLCIKARNYKLAKIYWDKFLHNSNKISNKCSCNG